MRSAILLLLAATSIFGQTQETPLNVTIQEPTRNCPEVALRVVVSTVSGVRVRGLDAHNFLVAENQSAMEISVAEIAPGEYRIVYNSTAVSLRVQINVGVSTQSGRGSAGLLTTSCALRITCGDLPTAIVNQPYRAQLQYTVPAGYSGGTVAISPVSSVLRVNPDTGELTGQFPTPGTFNFTASVTIIDSFSGPFAAQTACQVRIDLGRITFTDFAPKSGTACTPGFPITATGTGFQRPQGNLGSFIVFDNNVLSGGTLDATGTTLTYPVPDELLRAFRSSANVGVTTRASGIQNIDSPSMQFTFRRTPGFATNFTQTSLVASGPATGTTPLNVDVLNLDTTTRLRITVGSTSRVLTPSTVIGGRLVFDVPNSLIAAGGTARISLVNADEANPEGNEYQTSCAANSSRTLTLGPATATISSLNPRSATACGPSFGLTVNGSNFATNSGVEWDGSALPNPQFGNGSIAVQVPGATLGTTGRTVQVRVTTPGSAASAPEAFTVRNAPAVRSLSTTAFPLNGAEQVISVTGSDFVSGVTRVRWSVTGSTSVLLDASVQSPTQLSFTLPARLLTSPGAVQVTAVNADDANPSGAAGTVVGACPSGVGVTVANPPATIRTLDPATEIAARTTPLTVTVNGAGFIEGAEVLVNGTVQSGVAFVSASQLRFTLSPAQLAAPATLQVAVRNPNAAASASSAFQVQAVPVGRLTITANPAAPATVQDITLALTQSEASPRQLRATLGLSFEPNADNIPSGGLPAAALPVFAAGGSTFSFDVPASGGALPSGALVRPGTVSGTVIVRMNALTVVGTTLNLLPSPAPEVRVVIPRTAPVIDSARIIPNTGGFDLELLAFSPVRNLTSAIVQINTVAGTRVEGDTRFTVDLTSRFNDWFRDAANAQFGGQFRLRIPFTLANGDANAIDSVAVTLTNTVGSSSSVTGRR
jgi:hypothetical protein